MIKITIPLLVYSIVCIVAVMLPASDGYNTIGWKLLVGQIYAIPVLIIAILVSLFLNKRVSHR
ncbi:DUF4017 family protein [Solibacillus sp. A46]|uniref:DUF4017 family protein n=1 Tax=Solibacillus faecavium TaxID=2762221 RepID=A0ABR8Y2L8_9BACL|nr:DUF4017 family protein [Solibacillus faecavium]MBD8038450.1 DUF4017 family protein [Solibacillus faecavium]